MALSSGQNKHQPVEWENGRMGGGGGRGRRGCLPSPWPLSLGSLKSAAGPRGVKVLFRPPHSLRSLPGVRPEALGLGCSGASTPRLLVLRVGRRGNFPEDLGSPLRKQEPRAPRAPLQLLGKAGGGGRGGEAGRREFPQGLAGWEVDARAAER